MPFLHPTHAKFTAHTDGIEGPVSRWSSRASRKNRFAVRPLQLTHIQEPRNHEDLRTAGKKSEFVVVEQRLRHPHTRLKVHFTWDVSFWVAAVFVIGSIAWVINGFLLYLPLLPSSSRPHANAAAWIAFAGGTLFEVGSYLMVVEAINAGHSQLFGPALWGLVEREREEVEGDWRGEKREAGAGENVGKKEDGADEKLKQARDGAEKRVQFRWIGTASWRELGFLASFVQLCAATVFWVSTITGIPGVIPNLDTDPPVAITDIFFWTPQVVGGTGFFVSSLLLMIEVQRTWWCPKLNSLGWHIGLWNLVGAVGFTLCGALGYAAAVSSKANYQSVLATFWGSWAFLIGSAVQLWETLWREDPESDGGKC